VSRPILGVLLVALLTGSTHAQSVPVVEQIRLGLPTGQGGDQTGRSRRNAWSPVYVKVKGGSQGNAKGQYQLAILSRDTEQALSRYVVPIPTLSSETGDTLVGYVRPEGLAQFEVQVTDRDGNVKSNTTSAVADLNREMLGTGAIFYVALGSRINLSRALRPEAEKKNPGVLDDPEGEDRGQRRFAYLDTLKDLPDRWFGYEAADIVFLTTGNTDFVRALAEGDASRREALAEWVARGGRLVISVGRNHQLTQDLLTRTRLIDVNIKGSRLRDSLRQVHAWVGGENPPAKVEIADLEVGPDASVLVRELPEGTDRAERPLVVQGSHGLGRVVLVGFDLEGEKFTEWPGSRSFWKKLDDLLAPKVQAGMRPDGLAVGLDPGFQRTAELQPELRRQLETFASVPVISFGWVALFILFYILLVGPFDYFVLKKWFKRLELTWITFPAIVAAVSVIAYLAAYHVKGDDLRVNKVDLIEVDLHPREPYSAQVYGTTWFSLFSPRIKNYTLGIEPSPDWVTPPTGRTGTTLCLLASPENTSRIGSQGLFPQPYDYAEDAAGVKNLPIPVWASRAFESRWRAPVKKGSPPLSATITRSRVDEKSLQGPIVNNLDVALEGVVLFHEDKMYSVGTLAPGETRRVEQLLNARQSQPRKSWANDDVFRAGSYGRIVKGFLFPELTGEGFNSGLRTYDQSWRLSAQPELPPRRDGLNYRPEIVLAGRLAAQSGRGQEVNTAAGTPSRLWLDRLPVAGETPPELAGAVTQETYLRVYIPVRR
jgi:hypothetical protein